MSLNPPNIASLSLQSNASGYISVPFSGKEQQFESVLDSLDKAGFIPESLIENEANWFYNDLGIDDVYFASQSVDEIVSHIHALYASKLEQFAVGNLEKPAIRHLREFEDHAVYFDSSESLNDVEQRIDEKYLNKPGQFRVESYKSPLNLSWSDNKDKEIKDQHFIKVHFVYKTEFKSDPAPFSHSSELDIKKIYDSTFNKLTTENTKHLYAKVLTKLDKIEGRGPVIDHYSLDNLEHRIIIGYRQKNTTNYSSALSALLQYYKLFETRKYVEQFSNGSTIISLYLVPGSSSPMNELYIPQVIKEASLLYCLPNNEFYDFFKQGKLSLQETIYAHCGLIFVSHFLNKLGPEYVKLKNVLPNSNDGSDVLNSLRNRLRSETYTEQYIKSVFVKDLPLISKLYKNFADAHYVSSSFEKTLSYQRMSKIDAFKDENDFVNQLSQKLLSENHITVLKSLFKFNRAILKTNFYLPTKVALSFRLNTEHILPEDEYPSNPFGMFFVVGNEFRGFHIRFRDIARGGIRIVQSRNEDAYLTNARNLIDENYNLANTQQRKNKDIPEGGSKGVILLNPGEAQKKPKESFEKYIDSILDLLLSKPEEIIDLYKKPEILFMGPDEGTSPLVDWATLHARKRGAPWWKSFFTGKSLELGGIPHDEFGMTTLSVRTYVESIYEKKGNPQQIFKFQTGGPSGDLGSNEILLSKPCETYVAIVDGPAIVGDPNGLNKEELVRLARERLDISHFNTSLLSDQGYLIKVDDVDVTLPNGLKFPNGVILRNQFHLKLQELFPRIDLFVPCGGRPESININNVKTLINKETDQSFIKYIVEGANLFITQDAKIYLENKGCVLFKDASTNKGGVTSSSKEVLSSLVLSDEEYLKNMCVKSGETQKPEFYSTYVKEVQQIIKQNAAHEFDTLWKLKQDTKKPFSVLSDELSISINELADSLANSDNLWVENKKFCVAVLIDALPKSLYEKINCDISVVLQRVPENYLKRIFSTHLASSYVYSMKEIGGNNAVKFLEYISLLREEYTARGIL